MRALLKRLSFGLFRFAGRLGLFVLPAHYYVPLARVDRLEDSVDEWARKSDLPGVAIDLDEQAATIRRICQPFQSEYADNQTYREAVDQVFGPGFGYVEAQALHAVVRHYKPARVIEVGSGVSTWCILKALELNEHESGNAFRMQCIEPNPSDRLRSLDGIELIQSPVQRVPVDVFSELQAGDPLFIDSTHTIKPGGDVNYLFLEILPRLAPGVVVHIHDIYFPYDYPPDVLRTYFQWMETSLLRAYLINNSRMRILFCMSHLHYERPDLLRGIFPEYLPADFDRGLVPPKAAVEGHFPASIFLQVV